MVDQINQLVNEFEEKVKAAEKQIQDYQAGKVQEFTVVLEYIQALNALAGRIQVSIGDQIRSTYSEARKAKQDRNTKELGYEPDAAS